MPRKKPFGNKKKKKQLAEKRQRKKDQNEDDTGRQTKHTDDQDEENEEKGSENEEVETIGLHHQPVSGNVDKSRDPNRFLLKFGKESKAELDERKEHALQPIVWIEEHGLEKSIESVYKPGSVLDMPKRPSWSYKMSKQKVEKNEEEMFETYKKKILSEYKNSELSYFECNLETWRQLWRVLEVSDIMVIVADARFPILHFSPALYDYVINDLKKRVVLLLNKIDLIDPELVVAWKHYFKSKYQDVDIVCFTSFPKDEQERKIHHEKVLKRAKRKKRQSFAVGARELFESCARICEKTVDLTEWEIKIENQMKGSHDEEQDGYISDSEDSEDEQAEQRHEDVLYNEELLTLGLVGHPNVGKSSLLNGLVGKKVVSTSRTPGHTKHFQTIFLTSTVRLCDSPGLVFPSLIDKQLQILSGLYPVSQVQEPYTSVGYLAARWPVIKLLHIVHPTDNDNFNAEEKQQSIGKSIHPWSAMDVCDAWAEKRGYLTAKAGRNDTYRAANSILRLAVEGKIPFYFYPPGFIADKDKWLNHPDTKKIAEIQERQNINENITQNVDSESESDENEGSDSTTNAPVVFSNPFALLADD